MWKMQKYTTLTPNLTKDFDEIIEKIYGKECKKDFLLPTKVVDNSKNIEVIVELPGANKEDIQININNNKLIIEYEKTKKENEKVLLDNIEYGKYSLELNLNIEIDENKIEAKYDNGILKITLPKLEQKETTKKIEIK